MDAHWILWVSWILIAVVIVILVFIFKHSYRHLGKVRKVEESLKNIAEGLEKSPVDSFGDVFKKNGKELEHLWKEFSESFVKDEAGKIIGNTKRPHTFFNKEHIFFEKDIDEHSIEGFGNRAVGIGIFGTFIGLTLGIGSLSGSIGDQEKLKQAIERLLDGAFLAFITSLIGTGSSVLFSFFKGRSLKNFEHQLYRVSRGLEKRFTLITHEQISQKQTKILEDIDEHLNLKLDEAPVKIAKEINPILSEVKEAVASIKTSGKEIVKGTFEGASLKIEEIIDKLSETLNEIIETQKNISSKQIESQEKSSEYLTKGLEDMKTFQNGIKSSMKELQTLINHLQEKIKSEESSLNALKEISSNSNRGLDKSEKIIENMSQIIKSLESFPVNVENSIDKLEQTNMEMEKIWEQYNLKFNEVDKSGERFFEQLNNGIKGTLDRFHEFLEKTQSQVKTISSHLASVAQELKETVEEFQDKN